MEGCAFRFSLSQSELSELKANEEEEKKKMKSREIIPKVQKVFVDYSNYLPLTIRQIYYRLVSDMVIPNNQSAYKGLDRILTEARWDGEIDASNIVDRSRTLYLHTEGCYADARGFLDGLETAFKLNAWESQPNWLEVWIEKDALSDVFNKVLSPYDITLLVSRGYTSFSFIKESADRLSGIDKPQTILYFGDLDASGLDIFRHIGESLGRMGISAHVERIALTHEQVEKYELPPMPVKMSDSRAEKFISKYGNEAWELDALPPDVLQKLIRSSIMRFFDVDVFKKAKGREKEIQEELGEFFNSFEGGDTDEHS
jgi:hypothetical protein